MILVRKERSSSIRVTARAMVDEVTRANCSVGKW